MQLHPCFHVIGLVQIDGREASQAKSLHGRFQHQLTRARSCDAQQVLPCEPYWRSAFHRIEKVADGHWPACMRPICLVSIPFIFGVSLAMKMFAPTSPAFALLGAVVGTASATIAGAHAVVHRLTLSHGCHLPLELASLSALLADDPLPPGLLLPVAATTASASATTPDVIFVHRPELVWKGRRVPHPRGIAAAVTIGGRLHAPPPAVTTKPAPATTAAHGTIVSAALPTRVRSR
mmetsp:Transcript_21129/g.63568  ORF Transcript_21129/g.63568 Transcript_21129/m.63568 type:complete len:235 (-) Transcript_21129:806-1510(-)